MLKASWMRIFTMFPVRLLLLQRTVVARALTSVCRVQQRLVAKAEPEFNVALQLMLGDCRFGGKTAHQGSGCRICSVRLQTP